LIMRSAFDCKELKVSWTKGLEFLYVVMNTPQLVNHKAYTSALLLSREMFISVSAMFEETGWLYRLWLLPRVSHVSVKQRMLPSLMSLGKASLARILSTSLSKDWTLASSNSEFGIHVNSKSRYLGTYTWHGVNPPTHFCTDWNTVLPLLF
jgi:hypothetical protein